MSLQLAGQLCAKTVKKDDNFEEELTCLFKIDIRNLANFEPSSRKSQKFAL